MTDPTVIVHPLVLISAVDHYKRMSTKRVVGILLGEITDEINVTNSFAIPFEESDDGWFYDTSYLQSMFELFHKVDSREHIVGWYHTGPRMYQNDIEITQSMSKICKVPYMVIINVHAKDYDIPVQVFRLDKQKNFVHANVVIEAEEAEEVGVEHLIRDLRDERTGSLKDSISAIHKSLKVYTQVILNIETYLTEVKSGNLKYNQEIINLLQEILNSAPEMSADLNKNMSDVYLCEMIRTSIGLNDLKQNRAENEALLMN